MKIGIDFDLTICDIGPAWLEFLNRVAGTNRTLEDCQFDYNLGDHFPELKEFNYDPMKFWDSDALYDTLRPIERSVESIQELHSKGHDIIFISYTKRGHFSSKVKFLKQHFPFIRFGHDSEGSGFIATKEKGLMSGAVDVMVDDRVKYLSMFDDKTLKILFDTPYTQDYDASKISIDFKSREWDKIKDFIVDLS